LGWFQKVLDGCPGDPIIVLIMIGAVIVSLPAIQFSVVVCLLPVGDG